MSGRDIVSDEFQIPPFLRQIVVLAVIFVAIIGLKFSSEILGPIFLAIFLSLIISPLLFWLEKKAYLTINPWQ